MHSMGACNFMLIERYFTHKLETPIEKLIGKPWQKHGDFF